MSDRVADLESAMALMASELAALRRRVTSLESGRVVETSAVPLAAIPEVHAAEVEGWLAIVGRTLVILGGAYFLRAITSAQVVSYTVGVAAGLLYGAPWLWLASRAGARDRRLDALCYAASTALIGYPLVWEATVRFGVFTPAQSAILLAGLTAAAYGLSAVRRLQSVAAVVTCGALASALGLAFQTQQWLPYTALAIGVGLATLWLGYLRDWVLPRWPAALVVNVMIVVLTGRSDGSFWPVLLVQLLAIGGYLGSFALRTLVRERQVIPFEVAQSVGVLTFVLGSVFTFVSARPGGALAAAIVVVLIGAGTYVVSFTMVARRAPLANRFFYSLLAFVLVMTGTLIVMPAVAPSLMGIAAVAAALSAQRRAPAVLSVQATLFVASALIASGVLAASIAALTAPVEQWTAIDRTGWLVLGCAFVVLIAAPLRHSTASQIVVGSRFVLWTIVLVAFSGALVHAVNGAAHRLSWWDAAWLATLRMAVMVSATITVAYVSRRIAWYEAGWLTYPLLVVLGIKLVASDLPAGRPVTLFLALAAYGIALIAAPRALRQSAAA